MSQASTLLTLLLKSWAMLSPDLDRISYLLIMSISPTMPALFITTTSNLFLLPLVEGQGLHGSAILLTELAYLLLLLLLLLR